MKKILLLSLVLFSSMILRSQSMDSQDLDFGQYLNSEFRSDRLESDTLAEAVYLFDIGKSFFEFDTSTGETSLHFIHRFKIRILSKAGFDWANVEIPLRRDGEKMDELRFVEGFTYTMENGLVRKTKLEQSAVFKEDRSSHFRIMKFAMPDVQVGSIIEVQYETKSPFMFFFKNWDFQKSIPVLYSQYTAAMVPFYNYTYLLQGKNKFDDMISGESMNEQNIAGIKFHEMLYTFVMRNLSAFRSEPYITCPDDYVVKLNFQLCEFISPEGAHTNYLSNWPQFSSNMLSDKYFGKAINAFEDKGKALLKDKTLPDSTLERAKYIYDWCLGTLEWNGDFDKYSDRKPADLLKTGRGTTADINLCLVGMLRAAGIEAYPVLVSTRDHGKFKVDSPFDFFFNYVIAAARIKGKTVLLDATESTIGFGNLPSRCINEKGFMPKNKKEFEWITLQDGRPSIEKYTIELTPKPGADSTDCKVHMEANGHFAMNYREVCLKKRNELNEELLSSDLSLSEPIVLTNDQNAALPFVATYPAKIRQYGDNQSIWVKPFLGFILMDNPLKKPTRQFPIDLIFKQGKSFNVTIKVPEGYELSPVEAVPTINDENFMLTWNYFMDDKNNLIVSGSYLFKKEVYDPSVYEKMKNYFRIIDQTFNKSLVLVRKTGV